MNLDFYQKKIASRLSKFALAINKSGLVEDKLLKRIFSLNLRNKPSQQIISDFSHGFYIYGEVGRGKTMLMKRFYEEIKLPNKLYIHFNSFMIALHKELHMIRKENSASNSDELSVVIKKIIGDSCLICFDEFQVVDIADAMLLSRIFTYFFQNKVLLVITSNFHPLELYKNGLQREIFLKFIREIFLKNYQILHLDSRTDYRQLFFAVKNLYFTQQNQGLLKFNQLKEIAVAGLKPVKKIIEVYGRKIEIDEAYAKTAIINASWLLESEFFIADFQEICRNFDIVFLQNLGQFNELKINEARRFTAFIDEAYEQKIILVIFAKFELDQLCLKNERLKFFDRTTSRIAEITSRKSEFT